MKILKKILRFPFVVLGMILILIGAIIATIGILFIDYKTFKETYKKLKNG